MTNFLLVIGVVGLLLSIIIGILWGTKTVSKEEQRQRQIEYQKWKNQIKKEYHQTGKRERGHK